MKVDKKLNPKSKKEMKVLNLKLLIKIMMNYFMLKSLKRLKMIKDNLIKKEKY